MNMNRNEISQVKAFHWYQIVHYMSTNGIRVIRPLYIIFTRGIKAYKL